MPLGVDHLVRAIADDEAIGVPLPLMPLGVDHITLSMSAMTFIKVPLPLMPLGVDHYSQTGMRYLLLPCLYL